MQDGLPIFLESEEQRTGRNKETTIDHSYISGGAYRRKFNSISDEPKLQRLLYQLAKEMLVHRSGTLYEDMYWIDLDSMSVIAREIDAAQEEMIVYSKRTKEAVRGHDNILTMHTHPNSYPPSIQDFNSNLDNGYNIGIVLCHDGKIYAYRSEEAVEENYYSAVVAKYIKAGYNECEAQLNALTEVSGHFKIFFKEVTAYDYGLRK